MLRSLLRGYSAHRRSLHPGCGRWPGREVLFLTPGGIRLPGYNTGFIGGAGGYVSGNAVFFGDVRRHPDGERIGLALAQRGIVCHALSEDPLTDFGGIKFFPQTA